MALFDVFDVKYQIFEVLRYLLATIYYEQIKSS